ncbi:MAG: hypothetical protein WKG00_23265 [Polyangiaceae bacterium]
MPGSRTGVLAVVLATSASASCTSPTGPAGPADPPRAAATTTPAPLPPAPSFAASDPAGPPDTGPFRLLDCAGRHCCVARGPSHVWCWGANDHGQLGDGSTTRRERPVRVVGTRKGLRVEQVALGKDRSYLRYDDGRLQGWGEKRTYFEAASLQAISTTDYEDVKSLAVGDSTCVQISNGDWHCWGARDAATMVGVTNNVWFGSTTMPMKAAKAVAVGGAHSCYRGADDLVRCWGENGDGQLGDRARGAGPVIQPIEVQGLGPAADVAVGWSHSCAALLDGRVACWGDDRGCALGGRRSSPSALVYPAITGVQHIDSVSFTCALTVDGHVACWGGCATCCRPRVIHPLPNALAIAVGESHACALTVDGDVFCWGGNSDGQLGDGTTEKRVAPVKVLVE